MRDYILFQTCKTQVISLNASCNETMPNHKSCKLYFEGGVKVGEKTVGINDGNKTLVVLKSLKVEEKTERDG